MTRHDVAVVGGGIMGATVALRLARAGLDVALIDRGGICREASGVNAGTLTLHMTRAMLIPYAIEGWRLWTTAERWLGTSIGVTSTPGLCLAFTDQEATLLEERAQARRAMGAPIELISPPEARAIEPGLAATLRLAAHSPIDGFASAYLTGRAYRAALVAAGAMLLEHRPVVAIERERGAFTVRLAGADAEAVRATRLVLAGGVWLEPMLAWLGVRVPIKVLVNQLAVTERMPRVMRSVVSIANGLLSLKQFPNGTVLIGGGWQGRGNREQGGVEPVAANLVGNLRLAAWTLPALRDARLVRVWLGLEAETADALPIAGPVPGVDGAFAIGCVHSGYTSGPYIAGLLAATILGDEPAMPLFPVDRLLATREQHEEMPA